MSIRISCRLALAFIICTSTVARAQTDSSRSTQVAALVRVPVNQWGASVSVIDSAEISASTARTFSELLQARRPGLRVLRSGGLVGDGALVMLRGPTSLIGSNTPIVIVDGVRVDSRQYDQPIVNGAGVAPSRLDDILPDEIERIEVLSGPAAALYGDGAANGVILVTTKTGGPGPLRLSTRVSWSAMQSNTDFPANYQRVGTSPSTGQPVNDCSLVAVASGLCAPTGLNSWNPLERASRFRSGNSVLGRLALGGSALGTSLYAGVTASGQQGVLARDAADRVALRAKVARELPGELRLEASGGSLREHARSAVDGNLDLPSNVLLNGLLGFARDDANRGYTDGPPFPADSLFPATRLRHNTGGLTLRWHPEAWFGAAAMIGRDLVTERQHEDHIGPGISASTLDHRDGQRNDIRNSALTVSSAYSVGTAVDASTTLGLERTVLRKATFDSVGAPPVFGFSESWFHIRSTSVWVTETLRFPRDVYAAATMEQVTNPFDSRNANELFPSANVSWSPSIALHGLSDLRFRAAYAEAPGESASLLSFVGSPAPSSGPAPLPATLERTRQLELGGEATIGGLTTASLTAFTDRSTRLWAVGSFQFGTAAQAGTMTNTGVEALVSTRLLDASTVRWDGTFSLAVLHNRVTSVSPGYHGTVRNAVVAGQPLGGVWMTSYTYADANHDGIIGTTEVQLGPAQYVGPPLPTLETAFQSSLMFGRHVTLTALLDYRRGNQTWDRTGMLRCDFQNCRETQDPTAPLDLQAAAVASRLAGSFNSLAGFVSDASFMRVREIALMWRIPAAGRHYLGVDADVTFAGRNLAMWTNYRGLDPEINFQPPDVLLRQEFFRMPLPREFVVRLDIRP